MNRRLDSDEKDDVSETNRGIVSPKRASFVKMDGWNPDETYDWFPNEYRVSDEKPNGVLVCVGYSECLEKTLPFNLPHLDTLYVVTTHDDIKTEELCSRHDKIKVIKTNLFYEFGAKFNKGAALELALWSIPKDKWCLILDADICLPRDSFQVSRLDKNTIYGASRAFVQTEQDFDRAAKDRNFDTSDMVIGSKGGPIGFFQLFHPCSTSLSGRRPWYGIDYNNASWSDNIFQWRYPAERRVFLPITVLHIGEHRNWLGEREGVPFVKSHVYSIPKPEDKIQIPVEDILEKIIDEVKVSPEVEKARSVRRQVCKNVLSLHIRNEKNVGDMSSVPASYFPFIGGDIGDLNSSKEDLAGRVVIMGGGGILDREDGVWENKIKEIISKSRATIGWGIGVNNHQHIYPNYFSLTGTRLVGCRDWGSPFEWVPCVSCMSPLMDVYRSKTPKNDVGILTHIDVNIDIPSLPKLSMNNDMEKVLGFIADCDTLLTNTYHGAYWGTLLGKKIVLVKPFSSRFLFFRHRPVFSMQGNAMDLVKRAVRYPEALDDCRSANIAFSSKVKDLLQAMGE